MPNARVLVSDNGEKLRGAWRCDVGREGAAPAERRQGAAPDGRATDEVLAASSCRQLLPEVRARERGGTR